MRNTGGGDELLMFWWPCLLNAFHWEPNVWKKWNGQKNDAADIIGATAAFVNFFQRKTHTKKNKNDSHYLLYRKGRQTGCPVMFFPYIVNRQRQKPNRMKRSFGLGFKAICDKITNCLIVFLSIHTHRHATTWTVHLFYVFFFFFLVETLAATGISRSLMIEGSENLVKCEERQKHNQNNFFFYEPMLRFLFIFTSDAINL